MPKILKKNIISFFIALVLFLLLILSLQIIKSISLDEQSDTVALNTPKYMANATSLQSSEVYDPILSRIFSGDAVMVLGSSELTSSTANIPYNFLNDYGIPTVGFGHAYYELLAIYGYLSAYQDDLSSQSKIVIILSPGWFDKTDLVPQAFIEHFPPFILKKVIQDDAAREVFKEYVERNESEFNNASSLLAALNAEEYSIFSNLNMYLYTLKEYFSDRLWGDKEPVKVSNYPVTFLENGELFCSRALEEYSFWQEVQQKAISMEISDGMSKDTLWTNRDYFEKYLKNRTRFSYFSELNSELELQALDNVLAVLKDHDVSALFVMMPLNPYVYDDIDRFDPIANIVEEKILNSGMGYLNLIETPYQPGTLRDGMHMGELGWARMNEAIVGYYCK